MDNIQNSLFGKTSLELFQAMNGVTFKPCSRKSDRPKFQCLNLDDGQKPEWYEARSVESHGECSTLNIGASPNTARESFLSQVLESGENLQKYYLSQRACQGILARVKKAGKKLPQELEVIIMRQANGQ